MQDFQDITKFLLELSQKASDIMLKYYIPGGIDADIKDDNSPVTKADIEVNSMVIQEVKKYYPEYGIYGEEESFNMTGNKLFVVDPIDGTHMFAIRCPLFVFSAAVVIDGESIAGVLSNPMAKRTLLAEKGKGTYLVERKEFISASDKKTFEGALVNAGWKEALIPKQVHELGGRTPQVYSVCESASLVATGGFEGDIFTGTHPYDIAAAKIIVEEAGGKVTDLQGNEQRYDEKVNGAIMSNGHLHDQLVEFVEKAGLSRKEHNK